MKEKRGNVAGGRRMKGREGRVNEGRRCHAGRR